MTKTETRHIPDCKLSHPRDIDCAEAEHVKQEIANADPQEGGEG